LPAAAVLSIPASTGKSLDTDKEFPSDHRASARPYRVKMIVQDDRIVGIVENSAPNPTAFDFIFLMSPLATKKWRLMRFSLGTVGKFSSVRPTLSDY
jgi:hypothetical protein